MGSQVKTSSSKSARRPRSDANRRLGAIPHRRILALAGLPVLAIKLIAGLIPAFATALVVGLISASAASPPSISTTLESLAVGSTRAHVETSLFAGGKVEMIYRGDYATSEKLLDEGKGVVAISGRSEVGEQGEFPTAFKEQVKVSLGLGGAFAEQRREKGSQPGGLILHHLQPSTTYYARFHVENPATKESAERTFAFTTNPIALPEVARPVQGSEKGDSFSGLTTFRAQAPGPRSAKTRAEIESNGAQTEYALEYAPAENGHAPAQGSASWAPFGSKGAGTITVTEDYTDLEATQSGLKPETRYYVRLKLKNEKGSLIETHANSEQQPEGGEEGWFETPTAKPLVNNPGVRNVTGNAAHLYNEGLIPHGTETHWHYEYSSTGSSGPWTHVTGAEGTITTAEAQAVEAREGEEGAAREIGMEGDLTGLQPEHIYYVRLVAENEAGQSVSQTESFKTFGGPRVGTLAVHGLHGEALRLLGSVEADSIPTSGEQRIAVQGAPTGGSFTLMLAGHTTEPIAFDAPAQGVETVLNAVLAPHEPPVVEVTGRDGGPYTVYFHGKLGEEEQPPITGDGSALTPSGSVAVTVTVKGGEGYDTHYHFEYVSQKAFESDGGFAKSASTPEVDLGTGAAPEYVGADLPGLIAGETYRFRTVATNTSPGDPVVFGEEQTLMMPAPPVVEPVAARSCPNEALRSGTSALLPDCRAYEQVTPAEKNGTQEIYNYGGLQSQEGTAIGEDGDHLVYGSLFVKFGAAPVSGQSPYFFTREASGWRYTAGTPQPEAGVDRYEPQVFSPNLNAFAFESQWQTGAGVRSPEVEYRVGPPGGPYKTVATVTRKAALGAGWVAASEDFSKLILQLDDPTLLGHTTHTQSGYPDLYEYGGNELRQVNVSGQPATTIGTCGATIVRGDEGISTTRRTVSGYAPVGSRHAVSRDGSRVFFEAVPGSNCSQERHLYVRVDGGQEDAQTIDVGAYTFVAADANGSTVLLEKKAGEERGLYLWTGAGSPERLPSTEAVVGLGDFLVSENMSSVYFLVTGQPNEFETPMFIYRYDVPSRTLLQVAELRQYAGGSGGRTELNSTSPDGRYLYFVADWVGGLGGGGQIKATVAYETGQSSQAYRYDSREQMIQCISCVSASDPEPRENAFFQAPEGEGTNFTEQGMPRSAIASPDGRYVFFDTPAALLPADVDGELAPETSSRFSQHVSADFSLSSDVYEWRADGVDGCGYPQGCLALITTGGGGYQNVLLGTADEGRDVFFATGESLLPSDRDTAIDIYDARIGGGFAEPAARTECEGDACASPFAPPSDVTPASLGFQGAGNVHAAKQIQKGKGKAPAKRRCAKKAKGRCARHAKKAGHGPKRAGKHARGHAKKSGRRGR
jgi:hypothetical protein